MEQNILIDRLSDILSDIQRHPYAGRRILEYEIRNILNITLTESPIGLADLSRRLQIPVSFIQHVINLIETGVIQSDDSQTTSKKSPPNWDSIAHEINPLLSRRKAAQKIFDQCLATPETIIRRVQLMWDNYDLQYKRVLVLGDDDLLSLAIAFVGSTAEIQVIDIDNNVLHLVNEISLKRGLNVGVRHHDYRIGLPPELRHRFDVVFSDPPYTTSGIMTCVQRSIEGLKSGAGMVVYFCYSPMDMSPSAVNIMQSEVVDRGFICTHLIPNFNQYIDRKDMAEEKKRLSVRLSNVPFTSTLGRYLTTENMLVSLGMHEGNQNRIYDYEKS